MVDQLAADYIKAGKPVLFLEQNYQGGWLGDRIRVNRFKAAYPDPNIGYPLVIVDSGLQVIQGVVSYYNTYKALVDAELARAPQAEVDATYLRIGNHLEFKVNITNRSGGSLSRAANDATVSVIVYEDMVAPLTNSLTSRLERAVVYQSIETPLNDNCQAAYNIQTQDLQAVNWERLHAVAFVDYRPGGTTGPYDMLQAAAAVGPTLAVQPGSLTFIVTPDHPNDPEATLAISGSLTDMPWSVPSKPGWVDVTPSSGTSGGSTLVHVNASQLKTGQNTGSIVFTTSYNPAYRLVVPIQVSYTPPNFLMVTPGQLNFLIDKKYPSDQQTTLSITGNPATLTWSVTSKPSWATVTPATGDLGTSVAVIIDCHKLAIGKNVGEIKFLSTSPGTQLYQTVHLTAFYMNPRKYYFPYFPH